jgi:hypothetical protein
MVGANKTQHCVLKRHKFLGIGRKNLCNEPDIIVTLNQRNRDKIDYGSKNLHTEPKKILPRILHDMK